jgi:hypothetical protein
MPGVAAACAFALVASGCGSIDRREVAAADTARQLLTAVQNDDGAGACAVLAPQTAARLEQDSGTSCPEAILKVGLPQTTAVTGSTVYGQWAQVRLSDDTQFLAVFPGGWRVVAAGCRARGEQPYDCIVQEG